MKIKFDKNGYVTGYAVVGDMDGAVEFTGEIPDNFSAENCGCFYKEGNSLIFDNEKHNKVEKNLNNLERIVELKSLLTESDYKAIKYAEGYITEEEYSEVKLLRQSWRDEINELERLDTNH